MHRIAIIGGGIAGLTAAWEIARLARDGAPVQATLFESSPRLGGIIDTVREGGFVIETGPDGWLTAKPWAAELAHDLGLADELIPSNDASRKTWIFLNQRLVPMPDGMTLMVPSSLDALDHSPLFTPEAIAAYRAEPSRAASLLAQIPAEDESVAAFTLRHFGPEVLYRVAAPLLSGVFGGDVHTLSARATVPVLIDMERKHGSLIAALQAQRAARNQSADPAPSLFTTLRSGLGTLIDRLTAQIPPASIHLNTTVHALAPNSAPHSGQWQVTHSIAGHRTTDSFDQVLLALPVDATRRLLTPLAADAAQLLPTHTSSAVLVAFCFPDAARVPIPPGFGLLVPPNDLSASNTRPGNSSHPASHNTPTLLQACTFTDQKFPHRVPPGARLLRAYFGGPAALRLSACNNDEIAAIARLELARVLHTYTHAAAPLHGPMPVPLPDPLVTVVRRLPASLPQYAVGHLDRVAQLRAHLATHLPGLTLLGNSLHGLGLPDLIRDARQAAKEAANRQ